MEKDIASLQHTTWRYQYHVVFAPIAIFNNTAESTLTFEKKWYNRVKEGECYAAQRSSKVDFGRIR